MQNIFLARQPVYDTRLNVIGYELLFRARDTDHAEIADGSDATSQVIINSFINIGIDRLVGSQLAFINVPQALILNDTLLPMFHEHTVLELLEDIPPTPPVLAGIMRLKARGFALALDDFRYKESHRPLLSLVDYVKIDVLQTSAAGLQQQVAKVRAYPVKLVAEKVETVEVYKQCRDLGFHFFQGHYFSRPETLRNKTLPSNKSVVLTLLQQLADPQLNIGQLERTLAADPSLSYKLLRYVNSAAFGLRREIESLKDAVILVGLDMVRNWVSLILLSTANLGKPKELVKLAMVRAAMCERLAERLHPAIKSQMFITGLFSLLDAIMDVPMLQLLDNLALSAHIKFALLDYEGEHGAILKQVVLYEQARWQELSDLHADQGLLTNTYLDAVQWADTNASALID